MAYGLSRKIEIATNFARKNYAMHFKRFNNETLFQL